MSLDFRKLFKVTAKKGNRPELRHLFIKNGFVYATDSYKAIKLNTEFDPKLSGFVTELTATVGSAKTKEAGIYVLPEIVPEKEGEKYPDIERVIPTSFKATVAVNRKFLITLLDAMQKSGMDDKIILKVPSSDTDALLVESNNGVGILMPIRQ